MKVHQSLHVMLPELLIFLQKGVKSIVIFKDVTITINVYYVLISIVVAITLIKIYYFILQQKEDESGILFKPIISKDAGEMENSFIRVGYSAMQGWRPEMEDAHNVFLNADKNLDNVSFFAVFDGHGGNEVSQLLGKQMFDEIKRTKEYQEGKYGKAIISASLEIDAKMSNMFHEKSDPPGSTAIMSLIVGKELYVGNIGDSRCVVCINGKAYPMSVDHKPRNKVEARRIKKAGGHIHPQTGALISRKGERTLAVARTIGDVGYKKNKLISKKDQIVSALPDVMSQTIDPTWQFMLLACDGIWDILTNEQAIDFVLHGIASGHGPQKICMDLCDRCMGSMDNTTCILVCFLHDEPYRELVTKCKFIKLVSLNKHSKKPLKIIYT